jgi:hypothetical protein
MKRLLCLAASLGVLCAAQPAAAATNLIQNGGFEEKVTTSNYQTIRTNREPLDFGWSVNNSVDVVNLDGFYGGDPDPVGGGTYALDLVGDGADGGIYQSFNTEIGKTYRLTFDYAHNPYIQGASMQFGVSSTGGLAFSRSLSASGSSESGMNWQTFTIDFVANRSQSTLFFYNTAGGDRTGMYLDNIAVIDPTEPGPVGGIPEPATWALMIGGFGMAGATLRRKRRFVLAA